MQGGGERKKGGNRIKKLRKRLCQRCSRQIEELSEGKFADEILPNAACEEYPEPAPIVHEASSSSSDECDDQVGALGSEEAKEEKDPLSGLMDLVIQDDSVLDWWKKTSGLHTVEKWVKNYRKHPAGWAALLMIHGVPEMTGRLRSKVENYAIYAALFLSAAIPTMFIPWDPLVICTVEEDGLSRRLAKPKNPGNGEGSVGTWDWECEIRKRVFFYFLGAGIAAHMLCIMLSMSFCNALNEAARDSDVFRMFSRGQGFKATVKCQIAFRAGAAFDLVSMLAAAHLYMGWEAIIFAIICVTVVLKIYFKTANLLFSNTSIVKYWREELGGKPDADDPYDLQIPVEHFEERVQEGRDFVKSYGLKQRKKQEEKRRSTRSSMSSKAKQHHMYEKVSPNPMSRDMGAAQGIASGWM